LRKQAVEKVIEENLESFYDIYVDENSVDDNKKAEELGIRNGMTNDTKVYRKWMIGLEKCPTRTEFMAVMELTKVDVILIDSRSRQTHTDGRRRYDTIELETYHSHGVAATQTMFVIRGRNFYAGLRPPNMKPSQELINFLEVGFDTTWLAEEVYQRFESGGTVNHNYTFPSHSSNSTYNSAIDDVGALGHYSMSHDA